jgi:hypothetical protein
MEYPRLIENSARYYLFNVLQQCHHNRVSIYYYFINISVLVIFLATTALILYYCSQNKITDFEKKRRMIKDQEYVLSKIRFYQELNEKKQQSEISQITNLPYIYE